MQRVVITSGKRVLVKVTAFFLYQRKMAKKRGLRDV